MKGNINSAAILRLFYEHYSAGNNCAENITSQFSQHLADSSTQLSASDLAFLLRVGGRLVGQDIEEDWRADELKRTSPDHRNRKSADALRHIARLVTDPTIDGDIVTMPEARDAAAHSIESEPIDSVMAPAKDARRSAVLVARIADAAPINTRPETSTVARSNDEERARLRAATSNLRIEIERTRSLLAESQSTVLRISRMREPEAA